MAVLAGDGFRDDSWLVEPFPLTDPPLFPASVAQAPGVSEREMATPTAGPAGALPDHALLLVLDNCEHVLDGTERWSIGPPPPRGAGSHTLEIIQATWRDVTCHSSRTRARHAW